MSKITKIFLCLAISLLFLVLCMLGCWQLSRGYEKKALIHAQNLSEHQKPIGRHELINAPPETLRYKKVQVSGTLHNQKLFLLDNQMYQGQIGYHVLVPLEINPKQFILINRGWYPQGPNRAVLPNIPPFSGDSTHNPDLHTHKREITIEGYLEKGYVNPLITKTLENNTISWPLRIQHIEIELLSQILEGNLLSLMLVLEQPHEGLLKPLPKSKAWLTPEKHFGYAFQWFSLAITLVIMTFISVRKLRKS